MDKICTAKCKRKSIPTNKFYEDKLFDSRFGVFFFRFFLKLDIISRENSKAEQKSFIGVHTPVQMKPNGPFPPRGA